MKDLSVFARKHLITKWLECEKATGNLTSLRSIGSVAIGATKALAVCSEVSEQEIVDIIRDVPYLDWRSLDAQAETEKPGYMIETLAKRVDAVASFVSGFVKGTDERMGKMDERMNHLRDMVVNRLSLLERGAIEYDKQLKYDYERIEAVEVEVDKQITARGDEVMKLHEVVALFGGRVETLEFETRKIKETLTEKLIGILRRE
jgi:hypothetical protein